MAASQYLRPQSLLDTVKSYFTPDVVHSASSAIGESESSTRQALTSAVPSLLGGITNMASTPDGANNLTSMVREGGFASVLDSVSSLFSGGSMTSSVMGMGQQLMGKIFGNSSSSVADTIARSSGVSSSSASKLLSLASPLVMGVIGKMVTSQGLNASGLANMLMGQKEEIAAAAPAGLFRKLGFGEASAAASSARDFVTDKARAATGEMRNAASEVRNAGTNFVSEARRRNYGDGFTVDGGRRGSSTRWWPLLLVAIGILALLMMLRGRSVRRATDIAGRQAENAGQQVGAAADRARDALSSLTLPGGGHLSVPQGSINYNLAQYLGGAGSQELPKTFVFDHLNFTPGSTQLTPDSVTTVNDLATVLKAYPGAHIELAGYTDNTGSPVTNQQLSLQRANTVKQMLTDSGVSTDRISTVGHGQQRPLTTNDTEEGRAQNRRTELTVTEK